VTSVLIRDPPAPITHIVTLRLTRVYIRANSGAGSACTLKFVPGGFRAPSVWARHTMGGRDPTAPIARLGTPD